jgi:hypothetical protein
MVVNAAFNNIWVLSWRSVLLVVETGVTGENYRSAISYSQTLSNNIILESLSYLVVRWATIISLSNFEHGRRGSDQMVIGFTIDYVISAYHH